MVSDDSIRTQVKQLRQVISHATRWVWMNALIALLSAAISAGTYVKTATSDEGGEFVVMWGAVVFGMVFAVKHYLRRRRATHYLDALLKSAMEQRDRVAQQKAQHAGDQGWSAPKPGWYPSSTSPDVERWWTGTAWGPTRPAHPC